MISDSYRLQFITHHTNEYSYIDSARIALEGGCRWIQLRMKEADAYELTETAIKVKEMSKEYDITPSRSACILDTFSCVFQGVIPYGAQMLVAISAAAELGVTLSAFQIMQYLFYPYLLLVSSLIAIYVIGEKKK